MTKSKWSWKIDNIYTVWRKLHKSRSHSVLILEMTALYRAPESIWIVSIFLCWFFVKSVVHISMTLCMYHYLDATKKQWKFPKCILKKSFLKEKKKLLWKQIIHKFWLIKASKFKELLVLSGSMVKGLYCKHILSYALLHLKGSMISAFL